MKAKINLIVVLSGLLLFGCQSKHDYHSILKRELDSGVRYDSLFLGNYFGMSSEDFYKHSWDLNKTGAVMEGSSNATVRYKLPEREKLIFEYYPIFKDKKIQSMTGKFSHISWAPWNKETFPDKVIIEAKDLLEEWYGGSFIEVPSPGRGIAFAKIDGNRRIVLYYIVDQEIEVLFTDLTNDDGILTLKKS